MSFREFQHCGHKKNAERNAVGSLLNLSNVSADRRSSCFVERLTGRRSSKYQHSIANVNSLHDNDTGSLVRGMEDLDSIKLDGWSTCGHVHNPHVTTVRQDAINQLETMKPNFTSKTYSASAPLPDKVKKAKPKKGHHRTESAKSDTLYGYGIQPICYNFTHFMNPRQYIAQYREMYTKMKFNKGLPKPIQRHMTPRPISKASLFCKDITMGVMIRPDERIVDEGEEEIRQPKKVTPKVIMRPTSRSVTPHFRPASTNISSTSFLKIDATVHKSADKTTPEEATLTPSPNQARIAPAPPRRAASPSCVISRSRPTIPSNAHGSVHASAVEMPQYIVSHGIKGIENRKERKEQ